MVYIILAIVWAVIWGCITKKVNENKGYYGGFWLGFWLGFIGLIIVSCKEDNRPAYNSTTDYIAPLENQKIAGSVQSAEDIIADTFVNVDS